jgi:hypothetical protein
VDGVTDEAGALLPESDRRPVVSVWQSESCRVGQLENAIRTHRDQRSDDRCWMDDLELYKVLAESGFVDDQKAPDNRVGDKAAMLVNCARFIERRCEAGGWPTYAELESMLLKCGRHAPDCVSQHEPEDAHEHCNCGWNEIREKLWPTTPAGKET